MNSKKYKSALSIQQGIEQPSQVNPYYKRTSLLDLSEEEYIEGILSGDRTILSRAITLIESNSVKHFHKAQHVLEAVLPHSGNSIRVGITGVPGVGKSSFIESFGKYITSLNHKLAVLAIDPSSERSKGSILGDKTRMEQLSIDPLAFIRPSPSNQTLGGVSRKTRETMILCEAAGFDVVLIETVGVGQSETIVRKMVDFFLLLMLSGAGDELQGIKRGIMEMADAIVINKADGDNIKSALHAKSLYKSALQLFPPTDSGWDVQVETCSAKNNTNIVNLWNMVNDYASFTKNTKFFDKQRDEQLLSIFKECIDDSIHRNFYNLKGVSEKIEQNIELIKKHQITPYQAGENILKFSNIFAKHDISQS